MITVIIPINTGYYVISGKRHVTRSDVGDTGRSKIFRVDNFEIILNCKQEIEKYTQAQAISIQKKRLCKDDRV